LVARSANVALTVAPQKISPANDWPSLSFVIPTKTRLDLLESCLAAIAATTDLPEFDIVIVDNGADAAELRRVLLRLPPTLRIKTVRDEGKFNYSRLINLGVRASNSQILALMNDDVEAIERGWINRLLTSLMRPGVGVVGARLIYPTGEVQHAGVVLGVGGVCGHLWKGLSSAEADRNPYVSHPGTRLAVTGACMLVQRAVFDEVGGFDEVFPVAFNDIDFCLRVNKAGYRNIYRGDAILIHHESKSRGNDNANARKRRRLAMDTKNFLARWKEDVKDDPFGSPAFDLRYETGAVHPSLIISTEVDRPK